MPGGFKYVGTDSQGDVTGKLKTFNIDDGLAENITVGDLVRITGTSEIINSKAMANVALGPASTACTGVVTAIVPSFAGESLSLTYHKTSSAGQVVVNVDPNALYRVDASATMAITDVGQNCHAIVTAATPAPTGVMSASIMKADQGNLATTATFPLQIVALEEDSAGVFGNVAIVRLNETTVAPGATGI